VAVEEVVDADATAEEVADADATAEEVADAEMNSAKFTIRPFFTSIHVIDGLAIIPAID
jgi:hypothetical protein